MGQGLPVSENVAKCAQHPQPIQRLEELTDQLAYRVSRFIVDAALSPRVTECASEQEIGDQSSIPRCVNIGGKTRPRY